MEDVIREEYNLTPNKLKKFAAPFETETGKKNAGTYHKACASMSNTIKRMRSKYILRSANAEYSLSCLIVQKASGSK